MRLHHQTVGLALASRVYLDLLAGAASEHVRADLAKDALAQAGVRVRLESGRPAQPSDADGSTPPPPVQVQVVVPPDLAEALAQQSPVLTTARPEEVTPPSDAAKSAGVAR